MPVARIAIRLIGEHRVLFVIYVLLLSALGTFAAGTLGPTTSQYQEATPVAAVIDRDDSPLSRAISGRVAEKSDLVVIEDSTAALQDAAARNYASYVLVIPEGYGADLVAAARAGIDAPELECVVSYTSASGSLIDERVRGFAQELYATAAAWPDASEAELAELVEGAQKTGVAVETANAETAGLPTTYLVYCQFALYALFGGVASIIGIGLADLRRPAVRQRIGACPVPGGAFDTQIAIAIVVAGVAVWAVNAGVGIALYAEELSQVPVALVALMLTILASLALVGMAFGFLIWQLGVRRELVHAIANITAMIITFLAGTWVPISNMTPAVLAVAQFTPGYWAVSAMQKLVEATSVTGELVGGVLGNVGMVALFALAVTMAGLAVGRARRSVA